MRLEFRQGASSKFWEPKLGGSTLTVRFGRIGTDGQSRDTRFATPAAAKAGLAKLVAEKLGKGYVQAKGGAPRATRPAAPKRRAVPERAAGSSGRRAALIELARRLGGGAAKRVERDALLAFDDPERFLRTTKLELFEDWDDDSDDPLGWLALIESLEAARRVAEVDWKEAGDEILAWLRAIGGPRAKQALREVSADDLEPRPTEEALELFGQLLAKAGLALVHLDKSSDSYPLAVIDGDDVTSSSQLARAAGGRLNQFTGANLAKLEAARVREHARKHRDAWRELLACFDHMRSGGANAQTIVHEIGYGNDADVVGEVRAALPFIPRRDLPLIEAALAMHDGPATKVARSLRDPALALRVLLCANRDEPVEMLRAALIVADRLKLKPGITPAHAELVWSFGFDPKQSKATLAKLTAAERARLVAFAHELFRGRARDCKNHALRAFAAIGDATSLELVTAYKHTEEVRWAKFVRTHRNYDPVRFGEDSLVTIAIRELSKRLGIRAAKA